MGAGQSSSNGAAGAQRSTDVKTSYYDLLGLTRQATEDEIKKAYRRKALELHPDRNYGNEESATKTFAEVQAAYQVLSDPQERAWYDSHESAILRGDDVGDEDSPTYSNIRMTSADDLARMVRKFNSNVEFTDAPSGFFGYLREQFEQLANEEDAAADWENVEAPEYPTFGHKDDTHDDVVKSFYSAWANFATAKTFAWRDKYRLSEAPDRRIRRLMEKENNTARQEGVREFNEAVRALVAFIRKRDPRYTPSTQSEEERQKALRDAAAAQAARARAANEAKMGGEVPEWTKFREPEELEESEEEEVVQEILECVACNKSFKSERQYEAHEKSKKHQKAVQSLQRKMKKDNANLDLNGAGSGVDTPTRDEDDYEFVDDEPAEDEEDLVYNDEKDGSDVGQEGIEDGEAEAVGESVEDENVDADDDDENQLEDADPKNDDPGKTESTEDSSASDEDDEYASAETVRKRLDQTSLAEPSTADVSEDDVTPATKKLGKAAQKRAKKAAAAATTTPSEGAESENKCAGCNAAFTSKTQLFQHLKEHPRHAALKLATNGGGKGKKGKGKK